MAKNEAKIKFTADTKEFNSNIAKANSEMKELRAELKLNATEMQKAGTSAEGLEKKHEILAKQLDAAKTKTEAMAGKLEAAIRIYGEGSTEVAKWRTQLLNARTEQGKLEIAVQDAADKLREFKEASQDNRTASEKLTDSISDQQSKLDDLKQKYSNLVLEQKDGTDEAKKLAREIEDLSQELKDSKSAMDEASDKADKLDKSLEDAGDSANNAGDGFTVLKGAFANLAADAISAAIGKVSEFIDYLKELPEATREIRQDMATLETSFEGAGLSSEQATKTWKELYTVFGEDDRAVEASNLIAKMSKDQEDLNDWVTITQGVWGSYQDSLPVEGLAEASMESAKTGEVTGVLADALNWSSEAATKFSKYMGEDVTTAEEAFNVALSECTTEQERQALITDTLTDLYGDAATEYEKASGSQLDAKEATAENILVQNELADTLEPVTTAWQELKNDALQALQPVIESVSGAMLDMMAWMKEHPTAVKAIAAAVAVLAVGLGGLAVAAGVYTAAQWAMNSAILANPITWIVVAIIAAIAALTAVFVVLWNKCEGFRNFFIEMWEKIKATWNACKPYFEAIGEALKTVFSIVKDFLVARFKSAWEGIKLAWSVAVDWFKTCWANIKQVFSVVKTFFVGMFQSAWAGIQLVWSVVTGYFRNIWNTIKGIFSVVKNVLTGNWSEAWAGIKNIVAGWASYFRDIWSKIKNVFSSVKSWFSNTFSAAWSAVKNIWSNVGSFFSNTVSKVKNTFSKVKDIITKPFKSAIDKVKSFFSNLKLQFPKIKLPHFKVTGKLSISPPSVPKLKIDWYKDGGIMVNPTIFGMNGNRLMAGGEAGPEAILPIDKLEGYISGAVEKAQNVVNLDSLAKAIEDLANRPTTLNINGRQFAYATASDTDSVGGMRSTFKSRGLAVD
jgi:phage-related protein